MAKGNPECLIETKPKKTRQGQGQNSKPNHNRKKLRGQGRR